MWSIGLGADNIMINNLCRKSSHQKSYILVQRVNSEPEENAKENLEERHSKNGKWMLESEVFHKVSRTVLIERDHLKKDMRDGSEQVMIFQEGTSERGNREMNGKRKAEGEG